MKVSMIKTNWDLTQFVARPVSALLCALTLATWVVPMLPALLARRRA
jgi:TctA family transporter